MRIDTHQHFWKLERGDYGWLTPELAPLYRDFLPDDLKPLLDAAQLDATIAVQAADSEAETEFLLQLADSHDWIIGVVGWVDLEAETARASLSRLAAHPKLIGVRPMIQDIPDDAWMMRDALKPAIASMIDHDLTFDALVKPQHLRYLHEFIQKYPDLRIVVDHCAKPEIRSRAFDGWASDVADIALSPNVFCKLSGLTTEAGEDWSFEDIEPYLERIFQVFGKERLLFGSDWPVLNLASDYLAWQKYLSSWLSTKGIDLGDLKCRDAYPRLA